MIGFEGQRGLAPEAAIEWSKGNKYRHMHGQCSGDGSDLCLWSAQAESPYGPQLLQDSPTLRQVTQNREKRKRALKGNRVSSGPTLRYSAQAIWDQTSLSMGW